MRIGVMSNRILMQVRAADGATRCSRARTPYVLVLALALSSAASVAHANSSRWATRVGYSPGFDAIYACEPSIAGTGSSSSPQSVQSRMRFIPSDSNVAIVDNATTNSGRQRSRVKCFATLARTGTYQVVTSGWSTDGARDAASATCPSTRRYAAQPQCQIDGATDGGTLFTLQFVYEGSDRGRGRRHHQGDAIGQLTGATSGTRFQRYQVPPGFPAPSPFPQLNSTNTVFVGGTDIGAPFFSAGKLHFAFGDTFALSNKTGWRSNVLASTSDLNPADGLKQLSFELDSSGVAKELFPTPATTAEVTAIPGAGVSGERHPTEP